MTYKDLLNFNDQRIVDEVYKRYKEYCDSDKLNQVYQDITMSHQNKKQTAQNYYYQIMNIVSQIMSLLAMFLFVILFVLGGSMILSFFCMWLHVYVFKGVNSELFQWMAQLGMNIYDTLFVSIFHMSSLEAIKIEPMTIEMFYVLALTIIFILIFIFIYIISMIKHKIKNKNLQNDIGEHIQQEKGINKESPQQLQKRIERSYQCLRVDEDDSWEYIRSSLERSLVRKNKDFINRYYDAYICLFDNYQSVEGEFRSLKQSQKIMLCVRTIMNSVKNILGTLSKPIFFSTVLVVMAYRIFVTEYIEILSLNLLLSGSMVGRVVLFWIEKCYQIVKATPFNYILKLMQFNLEVTKILATCIFFSVIYIAYSLYKNKIRECQRQYQRRLNYYLKMNQGIYDENKKLSKNYLYSLEFTVFAIMVIILVMYIYLK